MVSRRERNLQNSGTRAACHDRSVRLVVPPSGSVDTRLAIPGSAAFAGVRLLHQVVTQVVAGELDARGNITAATSTNGLRLVIGTL